jgi:hypothetical protein
MSNMAKTTKPDVDLQAKGITRRVPQGFRLTASAKYQIVATTGQKRSFEGTCLGTVNQGKTRLAIFAVPK